MEKVTVIRKAQFNAAHRLHNPNWDQAKNTAVFGKCSMPNYHGHNYTIEIALTGPIDPETGYVFDLGLLAQIVKDEIEERFDHRNLNLDTVEFKNLNPTAENITLVIYQLLRKRIDASLDLRIKLYETERNMVIYPPLP
ncbi:MAG TPA: 6-carboxytetrahydropterin synthase [Bacteroidia bacterium]